MTQLKTLIVTRTAVTDEGANALAMKLPNTEIQHVYMPEN
jgi:hypothetical protein